MRGSLGLVGLLTVACGPDVVPQDSQKDPYWEKTVECDPLVTQFVNDSKALIDIYKNEIMDGIRRDVRPDLQELPPEDVINLLIYDEVPIECAIPTPKNPSGQFKGGSIIINHPLFYDKAREYSDSKSILNPDFDFDIGFAERVMRQDGLVEGQKEVKDTALKFYDATHWSIEILFHEATHGALYYRGLPSGHNHYDGESNDPIWQYEIALAGVYRDVMKDRSGYFKEVKQLKSTLEKEQ